VIKIIGIIFLALIVSLHAQESGGTTQKADDASMVNTQDQQDPFKPNKESGDGETEEERIKKLGEEIGKNAIDKMLENFDLNQFGVPLNQTCASFVNKVVEDVTGSPASSVNPRSVWGLEEAARNGELLPYNTKLT
jgi:hypothetical protein